MSMIRELGFGQSVLFVLICLLVGLHQNVWAALAMGLLLGLLVHFTKREDSS
ncbi:MAG: hypothetical protein OXC14_11665 [Rhodospirillaceae bacterium]|nr:hypothetical protein [Rhodospirillaceae bacterium]